jgi:uncharacterized membrane protein YbjE (DUF340 family)
MEKVLRWCGMKCPLPFSQNAELRVMSLMLAAVSVGIATGLLFTSSLTPDIADYTECVLDVVLFVSGLMQGIGTFGKRRKLRQVGLVLSAICLLCIGGALVQTLFGLAILLLTLAVVNVYPLLKDVMGKPRVS